MSPDLHLVKGEPGEEEASTKFAPDRVVPVRLAQVLAALVLADVAAALFVARTGELKLACWSACAVLVAACGCAIAEALGRAGIRYTLASQRLEIERGLVARRRESIDLFRVRDVVLEQTALQRLRGLGTLTLFSTDQVEPTLALRSIGNAQSIYELLRDAASRARQQRVVQVDR